MSATRRFLFRTGKNLNDITWMEEGSAPPTTLKIGTQVNTTLKTLAGNTGSPGSSGVNEVTADSYVKSFKRSTTPPPNGASTQNIATDNGPSVLVWFDANSGTMNYYTIAKEIYANSDCSYMFCHFNSLISVDFKDINMSNVRTFNSMFNGCDSLTTVEGISEWDISSATSIGHMFYDCGSLVSLDLSNWNVGNVTSMNTTFCACSSLITVGDLSDWNTGKVTNMSHMFSECQSLTEIGDLSNWDVHNVTQMDYMFASCKFEQIGNLANWNTSKVTCMDYMFSRCENLTELNLSNFDTSKVTDMTYMFNQCFALTSLDLSNWNTGLVTDMSRMFYQSNALTTIGNVSNWNVGSVTLMDEMFYECTNLADIDLTNWNTGNVKNMAKMFYGCSSLTEEDFSTMNNLDTSSIITEGYGPTSPGYGFYHMFEGCQATPNWPGTFNEDGTYILPEPIPETHILYDSGSNEFTQNPKILSGGTKYTSTEYANTKMTAYDVSGIKDTAPPLGFWRRMTTTGSEKPSYQAYDGSLCLYFSEDVLNDYNYLKLKINKSNYGSWSGTMQAMDIVINDTITISKSNCSITQDNSTAVFTYNLASIAALSEESADNSDIEPYGIVSPKLKAQMLYADQVWLSLNA